MGEVPLYTPHPTRYALHLTRYTLHSAPYTPYPEPHTLQGYRGASLIRKSTLLGLYRWPMPRVVGES
jgi:hypothetical protein